MRMHIESDRSAAVRRGRGRALAAAVCVASALAATACTSTGTIAVAPAKPTLISVQGGGTFLPQGDSGTFQFGSATWNPATLTYTHHTATRVTFTVPYPTSIELAIDGKALTKVDRALSRNHEFQGVIENPGENPARWSVGIRTPFDTPYCSAPAQPTTYVLSIVNVSGADRSAPLSIGYQQPRCFDPLTLPSGTSTTHTPDTPSTPSTPAGIPGPCGGAPEQQFKICFIKPPQMSQSVSVEACSYASAVALFSNVYAGWGNVPGPCSP